MAIDPKMDVDVHFTKNGSFIIKNIAKIKFFNYGDTLDEYEKMDMLYNVSKEMKRTLKRGYKKREKIEISELEKEYEKFASFKYN